MSKLQKRFLSILLVIALCFSIGPIFKVDLRPKAEDTIGQIGQAASDVAGTIADDIGGDTAINGQEEVIYEASDGSYTIAKVGDYKYTRSATSNNAIIDEYYGKDSIINIPTTINGFQVTSIDSEAFKGNSSIQTVLFRNNLSIGNEAFANCKKLKSIYLPRITVDEYNYPIGLDFKRNVFSGCESLNSVSFENGIKAIPSHIFESCPGLTSITIPNSVVNIEDLAFYNCQNLEKVNFEKGSKLEIIASSVFESCPKIKSINLPETVTNIGHSAFAGCINLSKLSMPTKLINLGSSFINGTKITELTIPKSLTDSSDDYFLDWPFDCFGQYDNNGYLIYDEDGELLESDWNSVPDLTIHFEKGTTRIPSNMFASSNVANVDLPETITEIGVNAFRYCQKLESIYIPQSVISIDRTAFIGTGLTTIEGYSGTEAEKYALAHNIKFISRGKASNNSSNNNSSTKKSIVVYATKQSLVLNPKEKVSLAFAIVDNNNNNNTNNWKKMAVVISDPTVISVTGNEKRTRGYSFDVLAHKPGSSHLTVSDAETGLSTTLEITVTKSQSLHMYPILQLGSSFGTPTINGIHFKNYKCTYDNDEYSITMDAYNPLYYAGSVDIYDGSGKWLRSIEIERYKNPSSFSELFGEIWTIYKRNFDDIILGKEYNYYGDPVFEDLGLKHTSLKFKVPQGGSFSISNNYMDSPGSYIFTSIDFMFDAISICNTVISQPNASDSAKNKIKNDIVKTIREKLPKKELEALMKQSEKILKKAEKATYGNTEIVMEYESLIINVLKTIGYDWQKELAKAGTGAFIDLACGEALPHIKAVFTGLKFSNIWYGMHNALESSSNVPYTYYSERYTQYKNSNNNGVIIEQNDKPLSDVVVQAYKVSGGSNASKKSILYNISLVKNENLVQPSGKVSVSIPIPDGFKADSITVSRQESDGSWTPMIARVQNNGFVVFETDHFSLYEISGETESLTIKSLPNKVEYNYYECLDTQGLELQIGNESIKDGFVCTPGIMLEDGSCVITVNYGLAETNFTVRVKKNDFVLDNDGVIRYYVNGKVASDLTDVIKDSRSSNWYNVVNGVVTPGPTIAQNSYGWWYIDKDGTVDFTAQSIYQNKHGWWKTTNGKVTFKENGIFQNGYGWWRVKDSKVDFKAQGIYQNQYGWWKTTNGKVTFKENGVFQNENGWWKVKDSKVDFNFTGIANNKYGSWYIKNGKVDFSKNGKVKYDNKTYTIKNGKVV